MPEAVGKVHYKSCIIIHYKHNSVVLMRAEFLKPLSRSGIEPVLLFAIDTAVLYQ